MDVPFALLQYGLKATAVVQCFIQHVLATGLACIVDWHLRPQGVAVFLLQTVGYCYCYHGCFPMASNSITYNMVTGRHRTELIRIHERVLLVMLSFLLLVMFVLVGLRVDMIGCLLPVPLRGFLYSTREGLAYKYPTSSLVIQSGVTFQAHVQHVLFGCLVKNFKLSEYWYWDFVDICPSNMGYQFVLLAS